MIIATFKLGPTLLFAYTRISTVITMITLAKVKNINHKFSELNICFTLRHSFLAVPSSCKFHYTVGHKYHHSKIRFEHTLKHNLHFFGSSRLALLVPNVCILNQLFQPKNIKISTRLHSICFNISINLRKCIIIRPFE